MRKEQMKVLATACLMIAAAAQPAGATCTGTWQPGSGVAGVGPNVTGSPLPTNAKASIMWDRDGAGPEQPVLVVGGSFSIAGSTPVNNIALWNGTSWEALGLGAGTGGATNNAVNALAVMPNGDLVAAGGFTTAGGASANNIARWNGTAWSTLGTGANTTVNALAVTTAGDLVAGGAFTSAGGSTVNRIARWSDTASSWSAFVATNGSQATGLGNPGVNALVALPDGNLLVGGGFLNAGGGTGIHRLAIWNTATSEWLLPTPGFTSTNGNGINAVARLANGHIYVGGNFTTINGVNANNIAFWDGAVWAPLGEGVTSPVRTLLQLPSGGIVAGGDFTFSGSTALNRLGQWDGTGWTPLWTETDTRSVYTLCLDNANNLVVGGNFLSASGVAASGVARYNGSTWESFNPGGTTNNIVTALTVLPGGEILAGGAFTGIEGTPANRVAYFTGGQWTALDTGLDASLSPDLNVKKVLKLQNGDIVAAGEFNTLNEGSTTAVGLVRFSNGFWAPFSSDQPAGTVQDVIELPNGDLVIGGNFQTIGSLSARRVARWDGTTWHAMGDGIDNVVQSLMLLPNGHIVAGGTFATINNGTATANGIAFWDGTAWAPFSPDLGQNANVRTMQIMPNGDLVVAGSFIVVGANPVNRLARWDGTAWHTLGNGLGTSNSNIVYDLALLPNGDLIAGGTFTAATGVSPAPARIARWNGTAWSAMGSGCDGTVYSLAVESDGTLLVGGAFAKAGGQVSVNFARWECPLPTGACCVGSSCSITAAVDCAGTYKGDDTLCANVSCCPADFNGDSVRDVADLFAYINAWLAKTTDADFNDDTTVDVADLFAYINAWLAGC